MCNTCNFFSFQSSYYSKLEKADILEMTVKYLKNVKRQQLTGEDNVDKHMLVLNGDPFRLTS